MTSGSRQVRSLDSATHQSRGFIKGTCTASLAVSCLSAVFPSAHEPSRPSEVEQRASPPSPAHYGVLGAPCPLGAKGVFCLRGELFLPLQARGSLEQEGRSSCCHRCGPLCCPHVWTLGAPLTGSVRPHIPNCQDVQVCLASCPEAGEPGTHHWRRSLTDSLVITSRFSGGQPR